MWSRAWLSAIVLSRWESFSQTILNLLNLKPLSAHIGKGFFRWHLLVVHDRNDLFGNTVHKIVRPRVAFVDAFDLALGVVPGDELLQELRIAVLDFVQVDRHVVAHPRATGSASRLPRGRRRWELRPDRATWLDGRSPGR